MNTISAKFVLPVAINSLQTIITAVNSVENNIFRPSSNHHSSFYPTITIVDLPDIREDKTQELKEITACYMNDFSLVQVTIKDFTRTPSGLVLMVFDYTNEIQEKRLKFAQELQTTRQNPETSVPFGYKYIDQPLHKSIAMNIDENTFRKFMTTKSQEFIGKTVVFMPPEWRIKATEWETEGVEQILV